jgi:glycosyltransferase involved in cell wall biosynthesis
MRRKIILLGPLPPPYGGVAIFTHGLFESVKHRGVRLWAYAGRAQGEPGVTRFNHRRLGFVPLLVRGGACSRILDSSHFLVEHPNPLLVPLWLFLKLLVRFEWVKVIHDGSLPPRHAQFGAARRALFRMAAGAVTEFVVLNAELERWLREEVGVRQNVTLIRNVFPVRHDETDGSLPAEIEEALAGFMRRARRVCSIGVFISDYGFLHVALAVERLRRETGEDLGLVLLDGDFASDALYHEEVLRGREWITVLKNVARADVSRVLRRCDAFVRATVFEGYGLSRVEAIWAGLPVVATRAGETRGMLLYDFGDVDGLAAQLRRALAGGHARETAEWAARYRREAEENLAAITAKLFED